MQSVTGRVPYYGHNDAEFLYLIKTQEPEIPSDIPEPLGGIIRGCLLKDRTLRPTATQLRGMLRDAPRKPIDIGPGAVLVGPGGRYRSIAEALAEVTDGARIYAQPGVYPGTLRLKREVEIHGLGAVADVVIDGRGDPCLVADAPVAVVRGVTLRSNAREGFGAEGGPEPSAHASASAGPRPTRRSGAAGFAAAWRRASPWPRRRRGSVVRGCSIRDGRMRGILVSEAGRGFIERCDISRNAEHGVELAKGCDPLIRDCRMSANGGAGVHVGRGAGGAVRGCRLVGNTGGAWDRSGPCSVDERDNKEE